MKRNEALQKLKENLNNKNLIKHSIAVEAGMEELAKHFDKDVKKWGLAGLLHDIDYEETKDEPNKHSIIGAKMLEELGLSDEIVYAVKVHNEAHDLPRKSEMDKALYAVDPLTGLIVASTLIHPEKKLDVVDVDFVMNRFDETSFARGANREQIKACNELDLDLDDFIELVLVGMQSKSDELGL
ncbi:HDIG domain-containing metalloprotein [Selenihalanaerobacter shriftii]|uniref:HDIG domain-containing protein n=1 Tax=Selenihalanaerobacter shriftii TaxID=142842 RepID=A0A1T4KG44_9FIRM|nr:HDIG domain-containing metalloprotein [Selenihalanaerobacter shriftii]SJZ41313.1 HDIG domain-containing protein [Selenihalanaerobacter shriftii]